MKMNKFTLGVIAGLSTLALAVPILAQVTSAAGAPSWLGGDRPAPTIAQVQGMIDRDDGFLKNVDAFVTLQKSTIEAHKNALTAALAITDDTAREAAVKKANDDARAAFEAAISANADLKSAMLPFHGGRGGPGMMGGRDGPNPEKLAAKLGITADQLKNELDAGKTIPQIAEEHGVTLPPRPDGDMMGGGRHGGGWMMGQGRPDDGGEKDADGDDDGDVASSSSAAAQ